MFIIVIETCGSACSSSFELTCYTNSCTVFKKDIFRGCLLGLGCELLGCELLGCELLGCELLGSELLGCELLGCELLGCVLLGCELLGCELLCCELLGYELLGCELLGCELFGCELFGCELSRLVNTSDVGLAFLLIDVISIENVLSFQIAIIATAATSIECFFACVNNT